MVRVAVQISGQQRYGSYFPQLVNTLTIFDEVDFFFHHWDGPRNAEEIAALVPTARVVKMEPPVDFQVKPEWSLLHPQGSSIYNLMSMTYGISEVNKLRVAYQEQHGCRYDYVIRARPDIRLNNFSFAPIPEKTVRVGLRPDYLPRGKPEIQDQIAIGTPEAMDIYTGLYGAFDHFHAEGRKFHPESYFHWWLSSNGISMDESGFSSEIEHHKVRRETRAVY